MRNYVRRMSVASPALVVVSLLGAAVVSGFQGPTPGLPHQSLSHRLFDSRTTQYTVDFGDDVKWAGGHDLTGKTVDLYWRWVIDAEAGNIVGEISKHATSYFPTGVRPLRDNTILVHGFTKGGKAVVERWTIGAHQKISTVDPTTGQPVNALRPGNVVARDQVFIDDSKQLGPIFTVFENMGKPVGESSFAILHNSGRVLELNLTTGQATAVLDAQVQPDLGAPFDNYWQADHATKGYLYFLTYNDALWPSIPSAFDQTILVLEDTNRDGVIDVSSSLQGDEFKSQGYGDAIEN